MLGCCLQCTLEGGSAAVGRWLLIYSNGSQGTASYSTGHTATRMKVADSYRKEDGHLVQHGGSY